MILAVVWRAAALLNLMVGRAAVNGALLAAVLIVVAAGALVVRMAGGSNLRTIGFRIGEPVIPLLIALWGARSFYRSHGWAELSRPTTR